MWHASAALAGGGSEVVAGRGRCNIEGRAGSGSGDVPTVLLDGKNTQSDRREVNRTVLSG